MERMAKDEFRESLSSQQQVAFDLANWWGRQIVHTPNKILTARIPNLNLSNAATISPYLALVTHNCFYKQAKKGIEKIGGVIGTTDIHTNLSGESACTQILAAMGYIEYEMYGKPKDGKTMVYLHPVDFFVDPPASLESPWTPLPDRLKSKKGLSLLKKWLTGKNAHGRLPTIARFDVPAFVDSLRILDNRFRIACL